jgi:hypothetical protein
MSGATVPVYYERRIKLELFDQNSKLFNVLVKPCVVKNGYHFSGRYKGV